MGKSEGLLLVAWTGGGVEGQDDPCVYEARRVVWRWHVFRGSEFLLSLFLFIFPQEKYFFPAFFKSSNISY